MVYNMVHGSLFLCATAVASTVDFDVMVYGSSPAGISAAVVAARQGMKVGLFEPLKMIGGMGAAGNLALNDGGTHAEKTGLALDFVQRAAAHYGLPAGSRVTHPEAHVSEAVFYEMLRDAGAAGGHAIAVKLDCHVLSAAATGGDNANNANSSSPSRVASVTLSCAPGAPVTATAFIDASYDGDIMTAVGDVAYTWGRESTATYNESLAGARAPGWAGVSGPQHVDALRADGSLLKYVQNISELPPPGAADDALMAFQHRLCVTNNASNRVDWPRPAGYDAADFELLQRAALAQGNHSGFSLGNPCPGLPSHIAKFTTCCGIAVDASDQPTLNKGWANASWERKQQIHADHTYFELGSYHFLANDPSVPPAVRAKFSAFGLCADEFVAFGNVPPQLYVRISNRLVGDYVMTQNNMYPQAKGGASIAVGDWSLDEHMTGKYAVPVAGQPGKYEVVLEGNFWPSVGPDGNWYDTPYQIMVPKRGTGANLLVPVAVSSSAVAFSSTRIENWYMSVGSAAGAAAQQLVDGSAATVQDVDVAKVRAVLVGLGQRVNGPPHYPTPAPTPPTPAPPARPRYYNVSGAGDAVWNAQYTITDQVYGGEPMYESATPGCPNGLQCSLYSSSGGVWRLASFGKELFYQAAAGSAATPPLSGWAVDNGTAPAPTLVAGPML